MTKRALIIRIYGLTAIACAIYTIYLIVTLQDKSNSIGIPFAFIGLLGLSIFIESILFAIIFFRHIKEIWKTLLPAFLIGGLIPFYFLNNWIENRPVKIPEAGILPVSIEQYELDKKIIISDFKLKDLDSNSITIYREKVLDVKIDTIIYSADKTKFFAIIIAEAKNGVKTQFCSEYRVGRKNNNTWELAKPIGNIWTTCFDSIPELKISLRQYFYKKYSINGSSHKPEIWTDQYIFNFPSK